MSPPGARRKVVSFGAKKGQKVPKGDIRETLIFSIVSLGIVGYPPTNASERKWQVWQVFETSLDRAKTCHGRGGDGQI